MGSDAHPVGPVIVINSRDQPLQEWLLWEREPNAHAVLEERSYVHST